MAYDGSLKFDTKVDDSGFKQGVGKLQSIGGKMVGGIIKGTAAAAAGVGAIAAASIKVGSSFEASMSQVAATMGITVNEIAAGSESFQKLEDAAREAGATTQFSAMEASEALNYLALAGYDTDKAIGALPDVLDLAMAGGLDLGRAADIATKSMNSLGLESDELTGFIDKIAVTAQKSGTDVDQLGEAMLTVGGTAKIMAGGTTEMAAQLGILADAGIAGAEGGTALRNVLLALSAPTKKQADALAALGVETYDANGEFRNTNDIFEDMNKKLSTMSEKERAEVLSSIFNKVDLKSANALLGASGDRFNELAGYIDDSNGAAKAMGETLNDNLIGKMEILKSGLSELGISIYKELDTPLKGVTETAIGYVEQLTKAFQEDGLEGMVNAVGDILANIVDQVANFAPKVVEMATSLIMSFVSGIRDNITSIVNAALDIVSSLIDTVLTLLPELISLGMEILIALMLGIADMLPDLITQIIDTVILIADMIIDNLPLLIEAGLQIMFAIIQGILDNLPTLIENVPRIINSFTDAIMGQLPLILKMGVLIILEIIKGLINSIPTLVKNIPQIIMAIVNVFTLYNFAQIGRAAITKIGQGITAMTSNIGGVARNLGNSVINTFKSLFSGTGISNIGTNLVKGIWRGISNATQWILNQIKGFGGAVLKGIKSIFGIKSPSTIMRDEIGKNLALGIGVGFEAETGDLTKDINNEMAALTNQLQATVESENLKVVGNASTIHKTELIHSGVIRLEGVNNRGEFVDAADIVMEKLMQEARGY